MEQAQTKVGAGDGPAEERTCARGRGMRLLKIREFRTRMRGRSVEPDLNTLRNGTYKSITIREVGSLGSESIYTNLSVRGLNQCFCTHFTRKGAHSRHQQTAISAHIAE